MMLVYVVNDRLEDFSIYIDSIETGGVGVFIGAKHKWGDNWDEYVVWHNNEIIQRVIHPDRLFGE